MKGNKDHQDNLHVIGYRSILQLKLTCHDHKKTKEMILAQLVAQLQDSCIQEKQLMTNIQILYIHLKQIISLYSEKKIINKCKQNCIVFSHPDFANEELYIVARYCRVLTEGPCSEFFRENTESMEGVEDYDPVLDEG